MPEGQRLIDQPVWGCSLFQVIGSVVVHVHFLRPGAGELDSGARPSPSSGGLLLLPNQLVMGLPAEALLKSAGQRAGKEGKGGLGLYFLSGSPSRWVSQPFPLSSSSSNIFILHPAPRPLEDVLLLSSTEI